MAEAPAAAGGVLRFQCPAAAAEAAAAAPAVGHEDVQLGAAAAASEPRQSPREARLFAGEQGKIWWGNGEENMVEDDDQSMILEIQKMKMVGKGGIKATNIVKQWVFTVDF